MFHPTISSLALCFIVSLAPICDTSSHFCQLATVCVVHAPLRVCVVWAAMTVVEILLESVQHAQRPEALVATQWPAACSGSLRGRDFHSLGSLWLAVASDTSSGQQWCQQWPAVASSGQ